jgi:hypothetical protein
MLKARLLKISTSLYLIDITIYYPPIKPLNAKLRYSKKRTYPLPFNIIYIKTYD